RASHGFADDVFLYFKTAPPPASADPSKAAAVGDFRREAMDTGRLFVGEFGTTDEFRERLHQDLRNWIERWIGVPEICAYALSMVPGGPAPPETLGESRLARLKHWYDPATLLETSPSIATACMWMYQQYGEAAAEMPFALAAHSGWSTWLDGGTNAALRPLFDAGVLVKDGSDVRFISAEPFYAFCAAGLLSAVIAGDVSAVERRP